MLAKHETFLKVQNFQSLLPFTLFLNLFIFIYLIYLMSIFKNVFSTATHVNIKSIMKKKV